MKIVIAPDSFKGSASSSEISDWIENGISQSELLQNESFNLEIIKIAIADGGEGSLDSVLPAGFNSHTFSVTGPLGNKVDARIGIKGDTALVELAEASGLSQLPEKKLSPLLATSFGTGELILRALDLGAERIILAVGGSACTDAGAGALQALGAHLLDNQGNEIAHGGAALAQCTRIDLTNLDSRLRSTEFILASDVDNPLLGPKGAAAIYAPQKGANTSDVALLEAALMNFADVAGTSHVTRAGSGAAGGFGFMAFTFLQASHRSGIDTFIELTDFESKCVGADLVITGEGMYDSQSLSGKAPIGIYAVASRHNIPVALVCGQSKLNSSLENAPLFAKIYTLTKFESDVRKCIENPRPIIEKIGQSIAQELLS
jgi:glycerate kinase